MNHSPGFLKIVEQVRPNIKETDIFVVKKKIDENEVFHLVDVREESEWKNGHLPNAIHLSKGIIERDIENSLPDKESEIVLYCGGGYRSALAAENLQRMGYKDVYSMDGGFRAWKENEFSIDKD